MFDPDDTRQRDLTGGRAPWSASAVRPPRPLLTESRRCCALVIGAGITGSLVAQHLQSRGLSTCIVDRESPGRGSTAASTAMLQWEIDKSLGELSLLYGFQRAARIYRASNAAVDGLRGLIADLSVDCCLRPRSSLYIAAGATGARELLAEHALRRRAELPGGFLAHSELLGGYGLDREAAILSPGSADADPLLLAHGLLACAVRDGARLYDAKALDYDCARKSVCVSFDSGHVIEAEHAVLATGYVMPDFVSSPLHRMASSWAIATPAQEAASLWRDGCLIWEASQDYLYARTTAQGRIIIGGEDDDSVTGPAERDAMMPEKTRALPGKLRALWPRAEAAAEFAWSGAFGQTADGLPLIGEVPGRPRLYAAYGYGGNGITFSFMASRIIAAMIDGDRQEWHSDFAIDRPDITSGDTESV